MKVCVWSYYSVDRPTVKFHCIWSLLDAPTHNYSINIAGLTVGRSWSSKTAAGPSLSIHSSQPCHSPPSPSTYPFLRPESFDAIARSENPLCVVHRTPRARPEVVPNPTRGVVTIGSETSPNIYKISSFYLLDSLAYLFSSIGFRSDDPNPSPFTYMLYKPT